MTNEYAAAMLVQSANAERREYPFSTAEFEAEGEVLEMLRGASSDRWPAAWRDQWRIELHRENARVFRARAYASITPPGDHIPVVTAYPRGREHHWSNAARRPARRGKRPPRK